LLNSDERTLKLKDICNCFSIQNKEQNNTKHCVTPSHVKDIILQFLLWSVPATCLLISVAIFRYWKAMTVKYSLFSVCLFFSIHISLTRAFDFTAEVYCAYMHCAYLNTAENVSNEGIHLLNYLDSISSRYYSSPLIYSLLVWICIILQSFGSGGGYRSGFCLVPPCPIEPMQAGSKTDPSLATAEPTSNGGSIFVTTYSRSGGKLLHNSNYSHREE